MFPLKSGLGTVNTPDPDQVLYQSLTAAAMHEIGQQAILDCSLLMFHQQAADVYYREDNGIPIDTNKDETYNLYTPEECEKIRKDLINVVMKFHILDENGLASRLTPLIQHLQTKEPISPKAAADPFIQKIFNTHRNYASGLFNQNLSETLAQIMNFETIENIAEEVSTQLILDSYKESDDMVNVAVYDDDLVQCVCEFCEGFFEIQEKMETIDRSTLNPIQQLMLQNYHF